LEVQTELFFCHFDHMFYGAMLPLLFGALEEAQVLVGSPTYSSPDVRSEI